MEIKKLLNAEFIEKIKKVDIIEAKEMLEKEILEKDLSDFEILELKKIPFIKILKNNSCHNYVLDIKIESETIKIFFN